jgi:hypothetical protein
MSDTVEQNADTVGAERLAAMIHTVTTALRLATESRARSAEARARMVRAGQLSPAPAGGGHPVGVAAHGPAPAPVWHRAGLKAAAQRALADATDPQDYLARLSGAGVEVSPRYSTHFPGMITGYALAGVDAAGQPRTFTGAELGLSWQQVNQQLASIADPTTPDPTQTITRGRKQP